MRPVPCSPVIPLSVSYMLSQWLRHDSAVQMWLPGWWLRAPFWAVQDVNVRQWAPNHPPMRGQYLTCAGVDPAKMCLTLANLNQTWDLVNLGCLILQLLLWVIQRPGRGSTRRVVHTKRQIHDEAPDELQLDSFIEGFHLQIERDIQRERERERDIERERDRKRQSERERERERDIYIYTDIERDTHRERCTGQSYVVGQFCLHREQWMQLGGGQQLYSQVWPCQSSNTASSQWGALRFPPNAAAEWHPLLALIREEGPVSAPLVPWSVALGTRWWMSVEVFYHILAQRSSYAIPMPDVDRSAGGRQGGDDGRISLFGLAILRLVSKMV